MPLEADSWYDEYGAGDAMAHRRAQLEVKLGRLALPADPLRAGPTLDVGCGFGIALELLHAAGYRRLAGLDLHDRPLAGSPERFVYLRGSAAALPFASGSQQLVCCFHTLHHLADLAEIERFLAEARRVLRPGGYLALIDFRRSVWLRTAIRLILWGLAPTPHLRQLRRQLRAERERMGAYFREWAELERSIRWAPLETLRFERRPFFFYYLGRKPT